VVEAGVVVVARVADPPVVEQGMLREVEAEAGECLNDHKLRAVNVKLGNKEAASGVRGPNLMLVEHTKPISWVACAMLKADKVLQLAATSAEHKIQATKVPQRVPLTIIATQRNIQVPRAQPLVRQSRIATPPSILVLRGPQPAQRWIIGTHCNTQALKVQPPVQR
jgi:hypothetical protein